MARSPSMSGRKDEAGEEELGRAGASGCDDIAVFACQASARVDNQQSMVLNQGIVKPIVIGCQYYAVITRECLGVQRH